MRSELQFFMSGTDEENFLAAVAGWCDAVEQESDPQWFLWVGDCPIQLLRCSLSANELISGRISLATTGFGLEYASAELAERTYNRMRRLLKKTYTNDITCRNVNIENSQMDVRNFWIGPGAIGILQSDPDIVLRQFRGGHVVFELRTPNKALQRTIDRVALFLSQKHATVKSR